MLDTSARLLELLSLFQAQRYWSGSALCHRLTITARTLRRDVDRLRTLGYPVNSTSGAAGGYQLGAGATLPPLLLDDEEAVAVAVGLRTSASGTVSGMEEASLRALAKLRQVLPQRLRERVAALHSFILPLAVQGPSVDAEMLSVIAAACRDCETLRFEYRSKDGTSGERLAEPHRLVHTGRRWYLAAWDTDRIDWRTFRIDRIAGKVRPGRRFAPRPAPEGGFEAYVARSVSWAPRSYKARVILHVPLETAADRLPAAAGILEPLEGDRCLLNTGSCSLDTLSIYLASLEFDFEVLEPDELVRRVRLLGERFTRAGVHNRDNAGQHS